MKTKKSQELRLLKKLQIALELDLMDPKAEAYARKILAELAKLGIYEIEDDDGCIACLDLTLPHAYSTLLDWIDSNSSRSQHGKNRIM